MYLNDCGSVTIFSKGHPSNTLSAIPTTVSFRVVVLISSMVFLIDAGEKISQLSA